MLTGGEKSGTGETSDVEPGINGRSHSDGPDPRTGMSREGLSDMKGVLGQNQSEEPDSNTDTPIDAWSQAKAPLSDSVPQVAEAGGMRKDQGDFPCLRDEPAATGILGASSTNSANYRSNPEEAERRSGSKDQGDLSHRRDVPTQLGWVRGGAGARTKATCPTDRDVPLQEVNHDGCKPVGAGAGTDGDDHRHRPTLADTSKEGKASDDAPSRTRINVKARHRRAPPQATVLKH